MVNKKTYIKERIKQVAEYQNIKYKELYGILGMTDGGFKGEHLKKPIKSDAISYLINAFPDINLHWLMTGEGEMSSSNPNLVNEPSEKCMTLKKEGVPYYDVEFTSGFTFLENSQTTKPSSYIAHPFFATSDFVVRNSGQSMAKVIKHGDAIGLKHLPNWQEFLAYGEIYAIVLADDRRLVKIITKGEDTDSFTLISKPSDNKKDEFPQQQIKKSLIRNVFRVEAASCLF